MENTDAKNVKKKRKKLAFAERDNIVARRQGVLTSHTSVRVGWAYKPHIPESSLK